MKPLVILYTCFNAAESRREKFLDAARAGGGVHPVRTREWIERRARLFLRYTLPSVLRQTCEDFLYYVFFNPGAREITEEVLPAPEDSRVFYCYDSAGILARIAERHEVILLRLDSDDMYAPDVTGIVAEQATEWGYFKDGYVFNLTSGRGYTWCVEGRKRHNRIGPFMSWRVRTDRLLAADWGGALGFRQHVSRDILQYPQYFDPGEVPAGHFIGSQPRHAYLDAAQASFMRFPAGKFCVTLHEKNTSSVVVLPQVGEELKDLSVLKEFGIG